MCDEACARAVFLSVGHGSCLLISLPPTISGDFRRFGVIDCCDSHGMAAVEYYLTHSPFEDERIGMDEIVPLSFVALTHFDQDHFKGMASMMRRFPVEWFIGPAWLPSRIAETKYNGEGKAAEELEEIDRLVYNKPNGGRELDGSEMLPRLRVFFSECPYNRCMPGLSLTGLAPLQAKIPQRKELATASNAASGALRVEFPTGHSMVVGGDVEHRDWLAILEDFPYEPNRDVLKVDVVGVPHHGGRGNVPGAWFRFSRVRRNKGSVPRNRRKNRTIAVISCGSQQKHTRSSTYRAIADSGCSVRCTGVSRECSRTYRKKGSAPPCTVGIDPGRASLDPFAVGLDARLHEFRARLDDAGGSYVTFNDPLDGAVCVEFRRGTEPKILHLGRRPAPRCVAPWKTGRRRKP